MFFDCRRPTAADAAAPDGEAVTLLFGPENAPIATLRVPESGGHELSLGVDDGTLEAALKARRSIEG